MRKVIYKVAQWLHRRKLLPWALWSPIFDRWHRLFEIDKRYARSDRKNKKAR